MSEGFFLWGVTSERLLVYLVAETAQCDLGNQSVFILLIASMEDETINLGDTK
ncbi:hypothetical protein [Stieleria varia]|uniref:hypothetical protein n=1 Tax=Stieleria varia TaxID=2528005 RepID=UPI0018D22B15|nr:hypothetical protein [Stieleria varia]